MAQARARLAACGAGDWAEALLVLEVARGRWNSLSFGLGSADSYSSKGRVSDVQRTDIADMDSFRTGMITCNLNESGLIFKKWRKIVSHFSC